MSAKRNQRGAALVVVLLLVATLSFVLLSLTTTITTGVRRGASERARNEMLWGALAAERISLQILEKAASAGALVTAASEGGLFKQQLALPVERAKAALRFADASRCFNVNSLIGASPPYAGVQAQYDELVLLLEAAGAGSGEASAFADAVTDFLDTDSNTLSQGSEDNFYTALTTPYRTAGGPVASVSELRSIEGVTREIYARIAPYLCARGAGETITVNVNALTPDDAPVIFALAGGAWPLGDIKAQIAATPPGGWTPDESAFWQPHVSAGGTVPSGRSSVSSTWIEARVLLEAEARFVEEALIIKVSGSGTGSGDPRLYSRVLGGGS